MLAHHFEHFARFVVLETRPAELVVGEALGILALGEDAALDRLFQAGGFELFQGVELVQAAQEKEIGDLLDDFKGVGDAAGPEGVPNAVDLAANFTG